MTELKPCKFCGMSGHGLYVTSNAHDAPFVECNDCGACGPVESREAEAIASWNRSGWQPIETAPNGAMVLCADMHAKEAQHWAFVGWRWEGMDDGGVRTPERAYRPATHWMPLPEPPQ